jgi:hypothetical protein
MRSLLRTDSSGTWTFLADAFGGTTALTDSTGEIQTQYTYEPGAQQGLLATSNPARRDSSKPLLILGSEIRSGSSNSNM